MTNQNLNIRISVDQPGEAERTYTFPIDAKREADPAELDGSAPGTGAPWNMYGYCGAHRCPPGMHYSETFGGCVYPRRCDGSCPSGTVANDKTADCIAALKADGTCQDHATYNAEVGGCIIDPLPADPVNPYYPWFPGFPYPGYPGYPNYFGGYCGGYPQFPYYSPCHKRQGGYGCGCPGYNGYNNYNGYNGYNYGNYGGCGCNGYTATPYQAQSYTPSTNPYLNIAAQSMGYTV
ncbi:hypothetical protein AGMMS49992_14140 [Clostridia bacterium]|nr:hypothetical protein AGMMS49992_14140 [Clostridia bacterium]